MIESRGNLPRFALGCIFLLGALFAFAFILNIQLGSNDSAPPASTSPQQQAAATIPLPTLAVTAMFSVTPTATVVPTATPLPTSLPAPTATPRATPMPMPTATYVPTPTITVPAIAPDAIKITDGLPTPIPDLSPPHTNYFPIIQVAPAPNAQGVYRQAVLAWMQELIRWADELNVVLSTVAPTAAEWQPRLATFETRLLALETQLHALVPPTGYVTAHEMLVVSMDSCTDAITHFKNTDISFGELSFSVCASGIILATSRLP